MGRAGETFLQLVHNCLLKIMVSWDELLTYFDNLFDEGKVFLEPNSHDNLLVDDEVFSRSRKYFWALSCLSEFEKCISDTIYQWDTSRAIWEKELPTFDPDDWENVQVQIKKIEIVAERLRDYRKRFRNHHENVSALRDGLFNASSVMESRAANQLGGQCSTFLFFFTLPQQAFGGCRNHVSFPDDLAFWLRIELRLGKQSTKAQIEAFHPTSISTTSRPILLWKHKLTRTENVKLLTFVSIFFLPLAFTTSIWSMNTDLLSITTLS